MAFSAVPAIFASVLIGCFAFALTSGAPLFRATSSPAGRWRAVLFILALYALSAGWASMGSRWAVSVIGNKDVYWGHRLGEAIAIPLIIAGCSEDIYSALGMRVIPPIIASFMMVSMIMASLIEQSFSMWFWVIWSALFECALVLVTWFGDAPERTHLQQTRSISHPLLRVFVVAVPLFYLVLLCLSVDISKIMSATVTMINYSLLDTAIAITTVAVLFLMKPGVVHATAGDDSTKKRKTQ